MAENVVLTLKATERKPGKKSETKQLRTDGFVPGVFYYQNTEPIHLSIDAKELSQLIANRPTLISLEVEGHEAHECMIREVQRHPVGRDIRHIDLIGITRGVKINATVQIELLGQPVGVKDQGGMLQQVMHRVDILCMPRDVPRSIEIDVSEMALGDSIHLRDIEREGIEWDDNPDRTVATVVMPRVIEEEPEEEELEGEELLEGEEGAEGEGEVGAEGGESEGESGGEE